MSMMMTQLKSNKAVLQIIIKGPLCTNSHAYVNEWMNEKGVND